MAAGLPPSPALDDTISTGQAGHRDDHQVIAGTLNLLKSAAGKTPAELAADAAFTGTFAPVAMWKTGEWYGPLFPDLTTHTLDNQKNRAAPLWVPPSRTIDRLQVEVTTAQVGATIRLLVYAAQADGTPGALLLNAGTVDASSIGIKEITVNLALTGPLVYPTARGEHSGSAPSYRGCSANAFLAPIGQASTLGLGASCWGSTTASVPSPFGTASRDAGGPLIKARVA